MKQKQMLTSTYMFNINIHRWLVLIKVLNLWQYQRAFVQSQKNRDVTQTWSFQASLKAGVTADRNCPGTSSGRWQI